MVGPLPADDLKLNPDASHPPFEWTIGIPSDWALLDTNPSTWQRHAQLLVDYKFAGKRLTAKDRRTVLGYLEQLVADCQRANAAITVVQFGRLSDESLGSAGVTMGWYGTGSDPATLDVVRDSVPDSGTVTTVETPCGVGLLHQDRISLVPPGGRTRVASQTFQLFVPVHGTSWIAIFSGGTSNSALERVVREVVLAMGNSLGVVLPEEAAAEEEGDSGDGAGAQEQVEFTAVNVKAPGIERGFGTLVRRRAHPGNEKDG